VKEMQWELCNIIDASGSLGIIILNDDITLQIKRNDLELILKNRRELITVLNSIDVIIDRLIDLHMDKGDEDDE
jgi:hypothetical protein